MCHKNKRLKAANLSWKTNSTGYGNLYCFLKCEPNKIHQQRKLFNQIQSIHLKKKPSANDYTNGRRNRKPQQKHRTIYSPAHTANNKARHMLKVLQYREEDQTTKFTRTWFAAEPVPINMIYSWTLRTPKQERFENKNTLCYPIAWTRQGSDQCKHNGTSTYLLDYTICSGSIGDYLRSQPADDR